MQVALELLLDFVQPLEILVCGGRLRLRRRGRLVFELVEVEKLFLLLAGETGAGEQAKRDRPEDADREHATQHPERAARGGRAPPGVRIWNSRVEIGAHIRVVNE